MSPDSALSVKYWLFGELGVTASLYMKGMGKVCQLAPRYRRALNDVYLMQLHPSHTHTHTHTPLSPGTPFPPISPESGPSLLTERITTAVRVRGSSGVVKDSERKREACVTYCRVATSRLKASL